MYQRRHQRAGKFVHAARQFDDEEATPARHFASPPILIISLGVGLPALKRQHFSILGAGIFSNFGEY